MRLLFSLVFAAACFTAHAQTWPSKPVRIVVAYPPGGGIDVMSRQIAEKLQAPWGQPVVVENRPGANTIVAADAERWKLVCTARECSCRWLAASFAKRESRRT